MHRKRSARIAEMSARPRVHAPSEILRRTSGRPSLSTSELQSRTKYETRFRLRRKMDSQSSANPRVGRAALGPALEVVIEVPRGSFVKRGSSGSVDFISPLPCPFNYGAVPTLLGLEGDLLDAVVLGKRIAYGTRLRVVAWGAVTLTDRGMSDDKLICSDRAPSDRECSEVLRFFHFYARCKGILNLWRRRPGRNSCDGWCDAAQALARSRPIPDSWAGPPVSF